jgi:signal transduction histidine kinase
MEHSSTTNHVERRELADLLTENRHEVERRWLQRVATEFDRHGVSETELRDSIPDYLVSLAEQLRREEQQTMMARGTEGWAPVAKQHALTRIQLGFDIDEVLQEFMLLRQVILEVLEEKTDLSPAQTERITILINAALRACVRSYVDHRDFESRREQAKHIGFITHELRNPLATATAAAGQLRKRASPELERFAELVVKSLKRMSDLVDNTLLSQRLEVREVELHPTEIRLGELMDQAIRGAEATAKSKGVELEVSYDADVLLNVDMNLALSAIQNVLDNAAKFTDRGRVSLQVEDATSEVVVHVIDNCEGLSPEELQSVFEPFKRGHTGKPGTGLGLAIARSVVEAHGKTIHAESTGDRGCHFWFALPKASH